MCYANFLSTRSLRVLAGALLAVTMLLPWPAFAQASFQLDEHTVPLDRAARVLPPSFGHVVEGGARCDLDQDGETDFIVGAPNTDRGRGAVYVFSGSDYSLLAVFEGEERGDRFGYSLDSVGDVNLDGYPDLLVGAPLADTYFDGSEREDAGKVYLFSLGLGPASITDDLKAVDRVPQKPYWGWQGGVQTGQHFGWSVSAGGKMIDDASDVTDAYYDFIVGSPGWNEGSKAGAGKVSVFKGGASYYWNNFPTIFESPENWHAAGDSAGYTVIGDWDFIGIDFRPDFAFSSPYRDGLLKDGIGSVSLVSYSWLTGNYTGGDNQIQGTQEDEHLGWSLAIGNLDLGDIYPDLIIGSPGYNNDQGRVACFHGGPTVIPFVPPHFLLDGDSPGDRFGWAIGFTPSVYDGNEEAFTVGAPQSGMDPGYARLFYYTLTDWIPVTYDDDAEPGDRFGWSICRGGWDPAQPTKKRMIIGAPGAGTAGEAWIYAETDAIRVLTPTGSYDPAAKALAAESGQSDRDGGLVSQACPNPFNPKTDIRFTLPAAAQVRLEVFDLRGQRLATLLEGRLPAGEHQATWEPSNHPSGTYFYRLQAGEKVQQRKIVLLK